MSNLLIGKDPDDGKDLRQEENGVTEDEMVGWHHRLYGHEFEQALGVGDGQGSLVCCSPWGHKELNMTEQLNWTELIPIYNPINSVWAFAFLYILTNTCYLLSFYNRHFDREGGDISLWFRFTFPWQWVMFGLFPYVYWPHAWLFLKKWHLFRSSSHI